MNAAQAQEAQSKKELTCRTGNLPSRNTPAILMFTEPLGEALIEGGQRFMVLIKAAEV